MTEITHAAIGVRDVVIVGGGPAAHRLADSLHARDTDRTLRVTVVGEELHRPYDRVALSTRLADAAADLTLQPTSMWDDGHIRLVTGERAERCIVAEIDILHVPEAVIRRRHAEIIFADNRHVPL